MNMTRSRKKPRKAAEKEDKKHSILPNCQIITRRRQAAKPVFSFIGGNMYKIMTILILCGIFYAMGYFTEIMLEFFQEEEDETLHR